jgi:hypothetical protein
MAGRVLATVASSSLSDLLLELWVGCSNREIVIETMLSVFDGPCHGCHGKSWQVTGPAHSGKRCRRIGGRCVVEDLGK